MKIKSSFYAVLLAMSSCMAASPVLAEAECGSTIDILRQISKFDETSHEQVILNDIIWVMWVNPKTGSWTLTATEATVTCAFLWGKSFDGQKIKDLVLSPAL